MGGHCIYMVGGATLHQKAGYGDLVVMSCTNKTGGEMGTACTCWLRAASVDDRQTGFHGVSNHGENWKPLISGLQGRFRYLPKLFRVDLSHCQILSF